ncbi:MULTISPECIES: efflux RND transporter permease subunit [Bradyrhizobium]|uniref:efflux RND transporter permease subunit n=1 Tax=Bradyrhizobium TaxID=374 RepID=UPI0011E4D15D|nr:MULTISPECIES: efflux RND transporter permease subunit [Bradyrhizobium]UPJ61937.1 efflux RND transporter permease subunit [Bradyrhizobium sp. 192]
MSYRLVGAEFYESRNAVGIGVASGMIAATGLRIFFVPALYVLVRRIFTGARADATASQPRAVAEPAE